jgi:hypothetical protein
MLSGVAALLPGITVFKGIPFAASTAGVNRWRPPQPPASWAGVRKADTFGPICPQVPLGGPAITVPMSEDCLYLNVWTGAASPDERRPVFVWIYGGRFIGGYGSSPEFDGAGLARKGLVVVTLNYRTGSYGFLAAAELTEESGHGSSGNYGLLDQEAALRWVQRNIAGFGGDPGNVTIAGQSAGSASVLNHVISPLATGLFHRAILESGAFYPKDPQIGGLATSYRTLEHAESLGSAWLKQVGAGTLAHARALPVSSKAPIKITAAQLPTSDGFTTVHDDLYVRILLLENGSGRYALLVIDTTSINDPAAMADMKAIITEAAGVATANIIINCTHNFSSPHLNGTNGLTGSALKKYEAYEATALEATTAAVTAAVKDLRAARVGYGAGQADVNVNRNVLTAAGWWLGTGEEGPSDKTVRVTRIDDLDGSPIAILANYSVQSSVMMASVMNDGALPITADLAGAAVDHVEQQYGGDVTAFFLCGATGDQSPAFRSLRYTIDKNLNWSTVDAHDAGWLLLTVQGERLGTEIVRVSQTIDTAKADAGSNLRLISGSVTGNLVKQSATNQAPAKHDTFTPDGTQPVPIWILTVGDIAFVGVEQELSTDSLLAIVRHSPFQNVNVMSMIEGGDKNMPDAWNYDHITYEALDSFFAMGTAEQVAARAGQLLNSLRG